MAKKKEEEEEEAYPAIKSSKEVIQRTYWYGLCLDLAEGAA